MRQRPFGVIDALAVRVYTLVGLASRTNLPDVVAEATRDTGAVHIDMVIHRPLQLEHPRKDVTLLNGRDFSGFRIDSPRRATEKALRQRRRNTTGQRAVHS